VAGGKCRQLLEFERMEVAKNSADPARTSANSKDESEATLTAAPNVRPTEMREGAPALRLDSIEAVADNWVGKLPQSGGKRPLGGFLSFAVCVFLPAVLAAIYYFFYASPQYVVEFRFSVRDTSVAASASTAASGIFAALGASSSSNSNENYMVTEYMTSLQAVHDLQQKMDLRQIYSRPSIDFWSRLDASRSTEAFAKYWKDNVVRATYDTVTGIATGRVHAFSAEDSLLVAKMLLSSADEMINDVAQRPLREAVRFSEAEVRRAEDRLRQIRDELAKFREKEGLIEPMNNVVLSNATLAGTVRALLTQLETDKAVLKKQGLGADAAAMRVLDMRIKATEEQLKVIEAQVSSQTTGAGISPIVARYEALDLERQFAQTMLTSTMQSLEQARASAVTKRLYITPFIHPVLPSVSTYPNRFVATLTVTIACLLLWTVALLVSRSIKEHLA
jgi:capsular polysaccharide transport system permease protein